jgi:hypothetical protein
MFPFVPGFPGRFWGVVRWGAARFWVWALL